MLAGDDLGPATSIFSMAKGKNSAYSSRIVPSCAMEVSHTWKTTGDYFVPPSSDQVLSGDFTVGYALTKKKAASFIQPKLLEETRRKGLVLKPIDTGIPLVQQGPFNIILHKLSGKDWRLQLEDYQQKYPDTVVVDSPESIQQLRNRQSMLQAVEDADLTACSGRVGVPKQVVITGKSFHVPDLVEKRGLRLPLVVKPLVVDGTAKSHTMHLAYNLSCLTSLEPPYVLQEFVNHGGVLFKVYVVGHVVRVVKRLSLPDMPTNRKEEDLRVDSGLASFSRISSAAAASNLSDDERTSDLPPQELLEALASEMRTRLGLQLFNIDLIRDRGTSDGYFVIDINYFPGYGKVPEYELAFSEFLQNLASSRRKGMSEENTTMRRPPDLPSEPPP